MPKFNQLGTFTHADVIAAIERDDPDVITVCPCGRVFERPGSCLGDRHLYSAGFTRPCACAGQCGPGIRLPGQARCFNR